jgi:uncharacterized membrane protein (UPF0127 family)
MRWTVVPSLILASVLSACAAGAEEPAGGDAVPRRLKPEVSESGDPRGKDMSPPRGYMGRKEIRPDEGMLFLFERPGVHRMWMKNCLVPIDMIWLNEQDRILAIERSAPPCRKEPCPAYGPFISVHAVLELKGGSALAEKLEVGDHLQIVTDSARH